MQTIIKQSNQISKLKLRHSENKRPTEYFFVPCLKCKCLQFVNTVKKTPSQNTKGLITPTDAVVIPKGFTSFQLITKTQNLSVLSVQTSVCALVCVKGFAITRQWYQQCKESKHCLRCTVVQLSRPQLHPSSTNNLSKNWGLLSQAG